MAVPRADATIAQRLKRLEEELRRVRSEIAGASSDPDDKITDPLGNEVVAVDLDDGQGMKKPRLSFTITTPNTGVTVTSTTWVEAFSVVGRRQNAAVEVRFNATCAAGTTGSVRAVIGGTATELHAPVAIADGDTLTAAWTIDLPGDYDDYLVVEIQAERLTGAGGITVRPYSAAGG